jgi:hypothetical protein
LYSKFKLNPFKNKEVAAKNNNFIKEIPSSRGDNSGNIHVRIMNLVTHVSCR